MCPISSETTSTIIDRLSAYGSILHFLATGSYLIRMGFMLQDNPDDAWGPWILTFTLTSPDFGGCTSMVSMLSGFFASQATAALHDITWKSVRNSYKSMPMYHSRIQCIISSVVKL